jgi:hypothetical protein
MIYRVGAADICIFSDGEEVTDKGERKAKVGGLCEQREKFLSKGKRFSLFPLLALVTSISLQMCLAL